jgi:hypothetical protein
LEKFSSDIDKEVEEVEIFPLFSGFEFGFGADIWILSFKVTRACLCVSPSRVTVIDNNGSTVSLEFPTTMEVLTFEEVRPIRNCENERRRRRREKIRSTVKPVDLWFADFK